LAVGRRQWRKSSSAGEQGRGHDRRDKRMGDRADMESLNLEKEGGEKADH